MDATSGAPTVTPFGEFSGAKRTAGRNVGGASVHVNPPPTHAAPPTPGDATAAGDGVEDACGELDRDGVADGDGVTEATQTAVSLPTAT